MIRLPMYPAHPERVCWGCDRYCPAHDMVCGNGSERTPHPIELFGDDWAAWAAELRGDASAPDPSAAPPDDATSTPLAIGRSSLGTDQALQPSTSTVGSSTPFSPGTDRALP